MSGRPVIANQPHIPVPRMNHFDSSRVSGVRSVISALIGVDFNANSRILGYRQSLSKIDKPFLTMLDKLCLHFFCSCLQFSVLTRFVCRICLHFDPGFGGFFADKVCLQDLSAFWPSFWRIFCRQSLSAGFVCILARFWRIFCRQSLSTEFVCQDFLCRQSLSAEPLQTKFVCMSTSSSATSTR